jgi:hypothetical protein
MTEDDEEAAKATKSSVNYREAEGRRECHNCRYSYGPKNDRRCMKVKGQIYPHDVCDLWRGM